MLLIRLFLENKTEIEEILIVHIDTSINNSYYSSKDEIFKNININNIIFNINQIIKEKLYYNKFKKINKSDIIVNINNSKFNEKKIFSNNIYSIPNLNLKSINENIDNIIIKYYIPKSSNDFPLNYPYNGFIINCYDEITYYLQKLYNKNQLKEYTPNIYNSFCNSSKPFLIDNIETYDFI